MRSTLILALGLMACKPPEPDDTGSGVPDDAVKMGDDNNYSITADIAVGNVDVQSGADSTIDWCALTTDLRGRPIADPSAVDQVLLIEFSGMTKEDIQQRIEVNDLKQADSASQWVLPDPGACSGKMSAFEAVSNVFQPDKDMVEDDNRVWLASVANSEERIDILMSTFVTPLESGANTTVEITDDASTLAIDADLTGAAPIQVKAGDTPWLDWSGITNDVNGKPFDDLDGDRLLVGKVPVETVEEVEELFLRLDVEAETLYYLDVYGETDGDLSLATSEGGEVFEGFTTDGVWLVGIECLKCISPAPMVLAVVEVTE